ncbi:MAG: RnfABCDGE type electron transport complex subunit D [Methylotetracoccus sp.]
MTPRLSRAPQTGSAGRIGALMRAVLLAMIPGVAVQIWQFGPGVAVNLALTILTALAAEAIMLRLRGRRVGRVLSDGSAVLTGALLGATLPPLVSWWLPVAGAVVSIVLGKQLYGGLGFNPFNPAMVGFAVLLLCFPHLMTFWPAPFDVVGHAPAWSDVVAALSGSLSPSSWEGVTAATPLQRIGGILQTQAVPTSGGGPPVSVRLGGSGWEWINLAYLAGGLWLMRRRHVAWQIPVALLSTLMLASLLGFVFDASRFPNPLFHLLSGATMLGAFFVATDPVSAATTPTGRLVFGAGVGALVFMIRSVGSYPDGFAFAILMMNLAAPAIDHLVARRFSGVPR